MVRPTNFRVHHPEPYHSAFLISILCSGSYGFELVGDDFVESGIDLGFEPLPRGTSQTCPECGIVAAKTLAQREHRCECGCVLDRDVAAAKVVHFRAFGFWPGDFWPGDFWPGAGHGSPSERVAA